MQDQDYSRGMNTSVETYITFQSVVMADIAAINPRRTFLDIVTKNQ